MLLDAFPTRHLSATCLCPASRKEDDVGLCRKFFETRSTRLLHLDADFRGRVRTLQVANAIQNNFWYTAVNSTLVISGNAL